jgi:uncharacterized protein with FMN-binding domain
MIRRVLTAVAGAIVVLVSIGLYVSHEFIGKYEDFEIPDFGE